MIFCSAFSSKPSRKSAHAYPFDAVKEGIEHGCYRHCVYTISPPVDKLAFNSVRMALNLKMGFEWPNIEGSNLNKEQMQEILELIASEVSPEVAQIDQNRLENILIHIPHKLGYNCYYHKNCAPKHHILCKPASLFPLEISIFIQNFMRSEF